MFWNKKKKGEPTVENTTPVPDIQIPDLKKDKEEDKKKAGIPIGGAARSGTFVGARGGAGAAARAAASAAAPTVARVGVGTMGGGFGGFLASMGAGKFIAVVLSLALAGGAGFFVYNKKFKKKQKAGRPEAAMGAVRSDIKTGRSNATDAGGATDGLAFVVGENAPPGTAAGEGSSAGDSGAAGEAKAGDADGAGDSGRAEGLEATQGMGATDGTGPTRLGPLAGAALSTQLGGSQTQARFNGPHGNINSGKLSGFKGSKTSNKGTAGSVKKRDVMTTSRMGSIRNNIRNSRSLGRLRAMSPFNKRIMSGGTSATEAESTQASTQFEASEAEGVAPPTSPVDPPSNPTNPTGTNTNGGPATQDCNCNWEKQTCVQGVCKDISQYGQTNTTPWKQLVEQAKSLRMMIIIMMLISAILLWIAKAWWDTKCSAWIAFIFAVIAYIMLAAVIMMAIKMIGIGQQVNSMGGKPQGDEFITMGYLYTAGAIGMMVSWFAVGGAGAATTFAIIAAIIMALAECIGALLK